jgi:Cu/Ag efflux protein CusF
MRNKMKTLKTLALCAAALMTSVSVAFAATFTLGVVKEVDVAAGKVTIIHEELVDLGMPAMTMVFRADKEMLARMSEGQNIECVADRIAGTLTVVEIK